jgi:hypothetical protein
MYSYVDRIRAVKNRKARIQNRSDQFPLDANQGRADGKNQHYAY